MERKAGINRAFLFLLVAFLTIFAAASFIAYTQGEDKITGELINVNNKNTIRVPDSSQPLPNQDEGTVVLWTKPPIEIFDQFSDARDYIIFFSATNMPGVRVVYNIRQKRFEAGSPLLMSPEIDIFDSRNHQLSYTFRKDGEQALFLDGKKVDSSDFRPMRITDVTGFFTALESAAEVDIAGLEVAVFGKSLSEDELCKV